MRRTRSRKIRKQRGRGGLSVNTQVSPISTNNKGVSLYSKDQFQSSGTPVVQWTAPPDGTYCSFVCADPDSSEPSWLHWLSVNCKGDNPSTGSVLTPWEPPTPPTGVHRYYFSLYSHRSPIEMNAPSTRSTFSTDEFVRENSLKLVGQTIMRVRA
jgi:phosphatidylethanolamine-binding protein (PEBP) family uncharacterized protein